MGNSPNTSIEKSVRANTSVVEERRDASTVDAISAELVDMEAGKLSQISITEYVYSLERTVPLCLPHSRRMQHLCREGTC